MTYSELVDLVLLHVNGGELNTDSAVLRADIESYVPAAAHKIIRDAIFRLKQEQRADRAMSSSTPSPVDSGFFQPYTMAAELDSARGLYYVDLPGVLLSLPIENAIESVFPEKSPADPYQVLLSPRSLDESMEGLLVQCWPETIGSVSRIYFYKLPSGGCSVVVRACVEISSMLGDNHIPLPVGYEWDVIELCKQHFLGQRSQPADVVVDSKDLNAPQQ